MVEVGDIRAEHPPQVRLAQDQEVIQARPPHAAEEALAESVRPRGADGRAQDCDPLAAATRAKVGPYLLSLSRISHRGASPNGVASRSCCATQASVGWRVTPTCTTRREPSAMTKNA